MRRKDAGKPVDFPETGYKWNQLGRLAQKFYQDYKHLSYQQLLEKLSQTKREITKMVEIKTNQELYETTWYKTWTMGRMIQLNTASPYKNALSRLAKHRHVLIK